MLQFFRFNKAPLKMIKIAFASTLKLFLFLRLLNFCPDFLGHVGKRLDKKPKVNFITYDVTNW